MINSEVMTNEIAISTFTPETIEAGVLTSTPMFLEETLEEQAINSEEN